MKASDTESLGKMFAPKVDCSTSCRKGIWYGSITIGDDYYYEADCSSIKQTVIGELIGCLEGIRDKIDDELVKLRKEDESKDKSNRRIS